MEDAIKKREEQLGISNLRVYWTETNNEIYKKLKPIVTNDTVTIYSTSNSGISLYESGIEKPNMMPLINEQELDAVATPIASRSRLPPDDTPAKKNEENTSTVKT
tara:strand:+ start:101 stop:415 length:315 start_codon:yes stop_codon:yes gene_type:complete